MLQLAPFQIDTDIRLLAKWVDTPKLNIAWASDLFNFPPSTNVLKAHFVSFKEKGNLAFRITTETNEIIGFVEAVHIKGGVLLSRLILAPQHQGKGWGRELMKLLITYALREMKAEAIFLYVLNYNKTAIALYEKMGFRVIKRFDNFIVLNGKSESRLMMQHLPE